MFRPRFNVGTMLRDYVKNPAFAEQKNSSHGKGFLWRTSNYSMTMYHSNLQQQRSHEVGSSRPDTLQTIESYSS